MKYSSFYWMLLFICLLNIQLSEASCKTDTVNSTILQCEKELHFVPTKSEYRLTLVEALLAVDNRDEALNVLRRGIELTPGNEALKTKLIHLESLVSEEEWIKRNRDNSRSQVRQLSTQQKLASIRCNTHKGDKALQICNKALVQYPDDSKLHSGKGRALMSLGKIAESILVFKRALQLESSNTDASDGLKLAESKRKIVVKRCLETSEKHSALLACDNSIYKGAPDEYKIHLRRGELLLSMNRKQEAIKAYKSAIKLRPSDKQINQILATLVKKKKEPIKLTKQTEKDLINNNSEREETARQPKITSTAKNVKIQTQDLSSSDKVKVSHIKSDSESSILPKNMKNGPALQAQKDKNKDKDKQLPENMSKQYSNSPLSEGITY